MRFLKKKNRFQANPLIISRPEALPPFRRAVESAVATVGWFIWFFLLRPLILILLWTAGFSFFMEHMVDLRGLFGLVDVAWIYVTIILVIFLIIQGWNVYNYFKYGSKGRRVSVEVVSEKEMEEYLQMPNSALKQIHQSRDVRVDLMPHHRIEFWCLSETGSQPIEARFKPS